MLGKNQRSSRPQMGTCSNSNTEHQYSSIQCSGKTENKRSFQASGIRGDSGADGLVAPLPCTAYFGKLAKFFGCSLPQQALA